MSSIFDLDGPSKKITPARSGVNEPVPYIKPPKGYSRDDIEILTGFVQLWYLQEKKLPRLSDMVVLTGWPESKVEKGLKSEFFATRFKNRGLPWPEQWHKEADNYYELTPQQVLVIQYLTDPTESKPLKKRLENAGINYNIYRNWMKQPKFAEALKQVSEQMIQDNVNTVHNALVAKAERGDTTAMRLYYEVSGRHDPMKQQSMDMMKVVNLLLEVITRYVTDADTLQRITNGFDMVIKGEPIEVLELPAAVEYDLDEIGGKLNASNVDMGRLSPEEDNGTPSSNTLGL